MVGGKFERTVADAIRVLVREDGVLTEIGPAAGLLHESGREAVSIGDVVDELSGHVVPQVVLIRDDH